MIFVLDPYFFDPGRAAQLPHRMQFLLKSLLALEKNIYARGGELLWIRGHSVKVVPKLVEQFFSIRLPRLSLDEG